MPPPNFKHERTNDAMTPQNLDREVFVPEVI